MCLCKLIPLTYVFRLLWILSARLARGCFIISEWDDQVLADQLCSTIYNEAEYIAAHAYELSDLIYEQSKAYFYTYIIIIINALVRLSFFHEQRMETK